MSASIYPNPASGFVTIEYTGTTTELDVVIVNILGETMYSQHFHASKQIQRTVDVSAYPKGMYLVSIKAADGTITRKLIIQ